MPEIEHHETWLQRVIPLGGGKSLDLRDAYALLSDSKVVDTAVIFVHGFLGDVQGTWLNFQEDICTPTEVGQSWTNCDVFFFGYPSFTQEMTESAEQLLGFIAYIFPDPPKEMFVIDQHLPRLPKRLIDLSSSIPKYRRLVLVGHSEGGVVVRRAVDLAWNWNMTSVRNSRLALFAPAHRGIKLSGWIGACLAIGRVDAVAMPILRSSPAFSEMRDENLLREIEDHRNSHLNEAVAKGLPLSALKAHVLFGQREHVVTKGFYDKDCYHASQKGRNHATVCKPAKGYTPPIEFVLDRVKGVENCTASRAL
jgi:pimeloyl-ACP methyl ester carboxylesterase